MKILHVTTQWAAGGSERNIVHHLAGLRDAGHDVHLAVGMPFLDDRPPVPAGIKVHRVPTLVREVRPRDDMLAVLHLSRLMHRQRFDVVHTHLSKAGICGRIAALGSGSIVLHTVHGPQTLTAWHYRLLDRLAAFCTDAFVFVGDELRREYVRRIGLRSKSSFVIHSPIATERYLALRAAPFPLIEQKLHALMITRLVEGKGLEKLPEIVHRLPRVRISVAGDGPLLSMLQMRAQQYGVAERLLFLGYVSNLSTVFSQAHILLHLSLLEGLPQVIVQALAAGRPVVALGSLGVGELVRDDINGVLLRSGSVEEVVRVFWNLHTQPERLVRLAEGARAFDVKPWDEQEICRQQLALVRHLGPTKC